jgi:hypothetical protein
VAPNLTVFAAQLADIDDVGQRQDGLEFLDAALVEALLFLGRRVFGVFGQITMGPRFRDRVDNATALAGRTVLKFGGKGLVATNRHRDLFHFRRLQSARQ